MGHDVEDSTSPGLASLVGGVVDDAQHLVGQQVELLRREIRQELEKAKQALIRLITGLAVGGFGAGLLLLTAAHVLAAFTAIPLWGCYAIVGGATLLTGASFVLLAKKSAGDIELLPPRQTAGAIKDTYQWITGHTKA